MRQYPAVTIILPGVERETSLPFDHIVNRISSEPLLVPEHAPLDISEEEFAQISHTLLFKRGFNLDAYKDRCVRRRIAIRIRANHCETVQDYCDLLLSQATEIDQLLKVLTIHVSQFFRNFDTFEKLRLEIIPQLFAFARESGRPNLTFWSLGCASGEEPYTLALILKEHFAAEMAQTPVIIEATDVDQSILDAARAGLYSPERLQELPELYLQKYFTRENEQFRLQPAITGMVTFRHGEMLNRLLYHECDLLLCRNVLIYFSREQQEKVLANIAGILGSHAYLVLGKSETILGDTRALFRTVCPVERIYRRCGQGDC